MNVKYLDHFNIRAPKEQLSRIKQFYIDVLGFNEGFRPKLSGAGQWLYAGSNAIVHLSEDENRTVRKKPDYLDHIAVRCAGVNEFAKKLNEFSIKYRVAVIPEIDLTQLFFMDPAGITIELNFKGETLLER
ncbi:MAG: VOC family protein [Thermodesulfobacteriota bacterium]